MKRAVPGVLGAVPEQPLEQQAWLVEIIRRNRRENRLDRVVTRSGKCIYECVAIAFDDGVEAIVFAIQVYDWASLGETRRTSRQGCVGFYRPETVPEMASREIRDPSSRPTGRLDPF
jgi:hypothetical protein